MPGQATQPISLYLYQAMPQTIVLHSARSGTGKSTLAANLAILTAQAGLRTGLLDLDLHRPGLAALLGFEQSAPEWDINSVLGGHGSSDFAVVPVWPEIGTQAAAGALYLAPATNISDLSIPALSAENFKNLADAVARFRDRYRLEILFVDTHAGFGPESLTPLGLADTVLVVLSGDQRDFQGAAVALDLARRLEAKRVLALVNQVPERYNIEMHASSLAEALGCKIVGVLPYSKDLAAIAGRMPFVKIYPGHPLTMALKRVAAQLPH